VHLNPSAAIDLGFHTNLPALIFLLSSRVMHCFFYAEVSG